MKEGPYAGTPESEWTNPFIAEVVGYKVNLNEKGLAWFKNEKNQEEQTEALRESQIGRAHV